MCPGPPPPVAVPSRVHPNAAQPHCAHPYALCPAFAPQCGMRPAPTAEPGQGCGAGSCPERSSEPDQPVPPPSPNVSGQADAGGERGRVGWRPWERGAPWHTAVPPLSPQSSARRMRARCRMLRCWRRRRHSRWEPAPRSAFHPRARGPAWPPRSRVRVWGAPLHPPAPGERPASMDPTGRPRTSVLSLGMGKPAGRGAAPHPHLLSPLSPSALSAGLGMWPRIASSPSGVWCCAGRWDPALPAPQSQRSDVDSASP